MDRETSDGDDTPMKLKAAFHYTIGKLCEDIAKESNVEFTREFVAAFNEVTMRQLVTFTEDLEDFAKHGKRTSVNADDIKLLVRRSSSLSELINGMVSDIQAKHSKRRPKRQKTENDAPEKITITDD